MRKVLIWVVVLQSWRSSELKIGLKSKRVKHYYRSLFNFDVHKEEAQANRGKTLLSWLFQAHVSYQMSQVWQADDNQRRTGVARVKCKDMTAGELFKRIDYLLEVLDDAIEVGLEWSIFELDDIFKEIKRRGLK